MSLTRTVTVLAAAVSLLLTGWLPVDSPAAAPASAANAVGPIPNQPDIIVIMTDDQRVGTELAMPYTASYFGTAGVRYAQAQVPTNLCCPARAAFLTGEYSHTTGVWENSGKNGGFEAFKSWKGDTLATNLQDVGYQTGLFGKYINRYNRRGGFGQTPRGWDRFHTYSDPIADGGYYTAITGLPRGYTTDTLGTATADFIAEAPADRPLFAFYSPYAPHAPFAPGPYRGAAGKALLQKFRQAGDLDNPSSREKDVSDKPKWVRELPRGRERVLRRTADRSSKTLMGVDANVRKIVQTQAAYRNLDNTIIVYLTDNGIAWGDHRLRLKRHPYALASRIPMLIKYPAGMTGPAGPEAPGTTTNRLVNQLDVTQTLADVAGARPTGAGLSLLSTVRDRLPLEAAPSRGGMVRRPGLCGVRTDRYLYLRYTDGTRELYDYVRDPYELRNMAKGFRYFNRGLRLESMLDPGCDLEELAAMPGRSNGLD